MRVGFALALVSFLGGCGFSVTGGAGGDGGVGDQVTSDALMDATFGCYGQGLVQVCLHADPPPELRYTAEMVIDTSAPGTCMTEVSGSNVAGACVIAARDFRISSNMIATGTKPLILVGTEKLDVTANIDAGSHRGGRLGPGASAVTCAGGTSAGLSNGSGGGGAGGSFAGLGGTGGLGSAGGDPAPVTLSPTELRAGCPGGAGADFFNQFGAGGAGGGALVLITGGQLSVTGVLSVVGQSGEGGRIALAAGGGGGGAGGMLILDGATVVLGGELNANGGGGGEGSDNAAGRDGSESASAEKVGEGGAGGLGGNGGNGSAGEQLAGESGGEPSIVSGSLAGGGGGGGGAGFIKIYGSLSGAYSTSPPAS